MTKIYVASSWRNEYQPAVVLALCQALYEVYDFRNPAPDNSGFSWTQVDSEWRPGDATDIRRWHAMTSHRIARAGFKLDFDAMKAADACVLVLPSGRSAHLEAGYFAGNAKRLIVLMPEPQEPDLMYLLANAVVGTIDEVVACLNSYYRRLDA